MQASWNGTLSTSHSEPLNIGGLTWPVELRPHPRARAMKLRLDEARQRLLLSFPQRMNRKSALDWAVRQSDWVDRQLANLHPVEPIVPGARIPFEGREVRLEWDPRLARAPKLDGDVLRCGGPETGFADRIVRHFRAEARKRLSDETAQAAFRADVLVKAVSVGDASSRWGSCSASGAIRYNWRIIMAPPHLLRWLVAHEVSHRRHMNHGPEFRQLEAELYGGNVNAARSELRALGPRLKRVGRGI